MDPLSDLMQPSAPTLTPEMLEQIVDALEQRVLEELERRGLRHHPGVF